MNLLEEKVKLRIIKGLALLVGLYVIVALIYGGLLRYNFEKENKQMMIDAASMITLATEVIDWIDQENLEGDELNLASHEVSQLLIDNVSRKISLRERIIIKEIQDYAFDDIAVSDVLYDYGTYFENPQEVTLSRESLQAIKSNLILIRDNFLLKERKGLSEKSKTNENIKVWSESVEPYLIEIPQKEVLDGTKN